MWKRYGSCQGGLWNCRSKLMCCRWVWPAIPWPTLIRAISLSHTRPRSPCGSLPFHYLLCKRTHPYPVTLLPIGLGYFQAKASPVWTPELFSNLVIIHLLAYEDGTECSERSAYKIQTPGNYPVEDIQYTEKDESLKSRIYIYVFTLWYLTL